MNVIVSLLWILVTAPVEIRFSLTFMGLELPSGIIRTTIYGVSLPFHFRFVNENGTICLHTRIGKNSREKLIRLKPRKKGKKTLIRTFPPLERHFVSFAEKDGISAYLGTGDAAATALLCGAADHICKLTFPLDVHITPLYHTDSFSMQIQCISFFRLGKIVITAALLLAARLKRKLTGGSFHGNAKPAA